MAQRHFWVPLTMSTILGLVAPARATDLSGFIVPVLMVMFFLVCLRVDFTEVVHHIRRPRFIGFVLGIYLVALPALLYVAVGLVSRDIAIGVLLLTSMPPGMAAPVFTDMAHGRVSLAMALTLVGTIASPFTVFALFSMLTQQTVYVELGDLFLTLLVINLLPLITAQAVKRWRRAVAFVEGVGNHSGAMTLLCLCVIVYVAVAQQASAITADVMRTATDLLWLYGLFILLHVVGYWIAPWRAMADRVALTASSAYMNNALAIGLSVTFFSPRIAFLIALSEIPWNTLPGVMKYAFRRAQP